jgi:hypothetical protein
MRQWEPIAAEVLEIGKINTTDMQGIPSWLSITPQFFTNAMEAGARLGLQAREAQQRSNDAANALSEHAAERRDAMEQRQSEQVREEALSRDKLAETQRQFAITSAQADEKIANAKTESGRLDAIREGVLKKNLSLQDFNLAQAKWKQARQPIEDDIQKTKQANELLRLQTSQKVADRLAMPKPVPEPMISIQDTEHPEVRMHGPASSLIPALGNDATNHFSAETIRRFSKPAASNRWTVRPVTNAAAPVDPRLMPPVQTAPSLPDSSLDPYGQYDGEDR